MLNSFKARLRLAACALVMICSGTALAQDPWPVDDPNGWGLAIVDVETTGLNPASHEMIDIGVIYTDLDGNELGRYFTRIHPPHPERTEAAAAAVNGYSVERWNKLGALEEKHAVAEFLAFHNKLAKDRRFVFTAYNAAFDKGFVDAMLQRHGSDFYKLYTYFLLDIPSVAWGAGIRNLKNGQVAEALGLEDEVSDPLLHTGATGAEWNLEIYRALRARENAAK